VMLGDQHFPVGLGAAASSGNALTPIPHGHPVTGVTERIGAAVDRGGQ
jgi:hypothetical protein